MPSSTISFMPILNGLPFVTILWWIFLLVAVIFCIHAVVVIFHWFTYGTERSVPLISSVIYVGFGLLVLIAMAITLATF